MAGCVAGPVAGDDAPHAPESAIVVDESDFDTLIDNPGVTAIVEFYSSHCPVCASMTWIIDSLAESFGDSIVVGANNIDDDNLWKRFSITSVPTYVFFRDSAEITRRTYAENDPAVYDTLAALLQQIIAGTFQADTADTATPVDTTDQPDYLTLDSLTFDSTVLRDSVTAMVFFLYAGGAPCIHMDSVVKELVPLYEGRAVIAKVHAGEQSSLSDRYGIWSVPKFLFFKDGVEMEGERKSGIIEGDSLSAVLDRLLADTIGSDTIPSGVVMLDTANFAEMVEISDRIAMVDFFSPLCPACRDMDTVVTNLAARFDGRALVSKVNVLEDDTLQYRFDIQWWPTFVFLKGGVEYQRVIGVVPGDSLAAVMERGLGEGIAESARAAVYAPAPVDRGAVVPRDAKSREMHAHEDLTVLAVQGR